MNEVFRLLDGYLINGCYIKVFISGAGSKVVRVDKRVKGKPDKLIACGEGSNFLSALYNVIGDTDETIIDATPLNKVLCQGYPLFFSRLANGQVLSAVCDGCGNNYVPIRSVITEEIEAGIGALNAILSEFDLDDSYEFMEYAEHQTNPVYTYKNNRTKKEKNIK